MEEKDTKILEKVKKEVEKILDSLIENGIEPNNVETLYQLIDIHKDIANENYWKVKEESMRYRNYGNYQEGSMGGYSEGGSMSGYGEGSYGRRGRYRDGGSYGRRGVKGTGRGRYRGEEMMEEMQFHYGNYNESGQYGAEGEKMEALENLMESSYEYFKELSENAEGPEEMKLMKHYFKKLSEL